jgi:hypothetical protein
MKLKNLDKSDNRTLELAFEAAPHIKGQLEPLLVLLDEKICENAEGIERLQNEVRALRSELDEKD